MTHSTPIPTAKSGSSPKPQVVIYTDGACKGNPGPGGFAAILVLPDGTTRELVGAHPETTNNQMELMAAISALESLDAPSVITVHTDSQYLRDGITKWMTNWKRNGWRTADRSPVKNQDLWKRLDRATQRHHVTWRWIRGHAGHSQNERADALAVAAIDRLRHGQLRAADLGEFPAPGDVATKTAIAPDATPEAKQPSLQATPFKRSSLFPDCISAAASSTPKAPNRPLILASTSPYRRQLLDRLGLQYTALAPEVDEHEFARRGLPPDVLVTQLARAKSRALALKHPQAILIGADQIALLDGEVLNKPGTPDGAMVQLQRLAGRTHQLLTAVAVHDAAERATIEHLDICEITLRPLTQAQIATYVRRDEPWDCAGSYRAESLGMALVAKFRGDDPTAVMGLPMLRLIAMLASHGLDPLA